MHYEHYWIYCPDCNRTLVVEARLETNCERDEMVVCPMCGQELGEVRADLGYDFVGLACGYLYPGKECYGSEA
jgi:transcription elongation factor Elf1